MPSFPAGVVLPQIRGCGESTGSVVLGTGSNGQGGREGDTDDDFIQITVDLVQSLLCLLMFYIIFDSLICCIVCLHFPPPTNNFFLRF